MKKIFSGLLSLLLCVLLPGILGYLAGHPILGLLVGVIFWVLIVLFYVLGIIAGAKYALKNPPKQGQTWIDLNILGRKIPISEKFNFLTPVKFNLAMRRHRAIYRKIREDFEKGGYTVKGIKVKHKLNLDDDTVRKILKEGQEGLLE